MTHTGKIGRLSQARRDLLGHRFEDGCTGIEIVDWLSEQPDVRRVLSDHFGGRPITEQNLSDWRQSGHIEWVHREEARQAIVNLAEQADDVQDLLGARRLTDEFALVVLAQIHRLARQLLSDESGLTWAPTSRHTVEGGGCNSVNPRIRGAGKGARRCHIGVASRRAASQNGLSTNRSKNSHEKADHCFGRRIDAELGSHGAGASGVGGAIDWRPGVHAGADAADGVAA